MLSSCQVFSTVQQKVSEESSTMMQFALLEIWKRHAVLLAFTQEARRFHSVWCQSENSAEDSKSVG